jgi:hypothetical protein
MDLRPLLASSLLVLLPLLLLLPTPLAQQPPPPQQQQQPPTHKRNCHQPDLRAFDLALKSIRVSHGPFCSEGRRPQCEDCASYYPPRRRPRPNPYKSHPKPPVTLALVLEQGGVIQSLKFLVSELESKEIGSSIRANLVHLTRSRPISPQTISTDAPRIRSRPLRAPNVGPLATHWSEPRHHNCFTHPSHFKHSINHISYARECSAHSAPLWQLPDYVVEPYGRFWADFKELTRRL